MNPCTWGSHPRGPHRPCTPQVPLSAIVPTFTTTSLPHITLSWSFHSMVSVHLKFSLQQLLGLLSCLLWLPSHLPRYQLLYLLRDRSQSHMGFEWSSLNPIFFPISPIVFVVWFCRTWSYSGTQHVLTEMPHFFKYRREGQQLKQRRMKEVREAILRLCGCFMLIPRLQGGPLPWKAEVCSPWNSPLRAQLYGVMMLGSWPPAVQQKQLFFLVLPWIQSIY